jgi:hypothetical protein
MGEYVVLIFLVVAAITGMTIFLQRALQGTIRDANYTMIRTAINAQTADDYSGQHYEPYYVNRTAIISQQSRDQDQLWAVGTTPNSGIFREDMEEQTDMTTTSSQLPPKEAR